jgi:hypothetical protein
VVCCVTITATKGGPHYLQSYATDHDRQLGTRKGSYRHFKQWIAEYGLYMHI